MISPQQPTLRATEYADLFAPAVVDVFAGCGGWSLGAEQAFVEGGYDNRYIDLMINHWDTAVKVHEANHPMTEHLRSDVREVDPDEVLRGRRLVYAHFSPDCTDHSKAKGGKPRRKEIRALADVVIVWARIRKPLVITLENVEEFQQWGPLLSDGKPDPKRRGEEFKRWVGELRALGYVVEWREISAKFHGVPTTRKRLFVTARCDGKPIIWPEETHAQPDRSGEVPGDAGRDMGPRGGSRVVDRRGRVQLRDVQLHDRGAARGGNSSGRNDRLPPHPTLKPFRPAAECIDWDNPMLSIFATRPEARAWANRVNVGREKHERIGTPQRPLRPNTQKRLAGGLFKWTLNHESPFIVNIQNSKWGPDHFDVRNPLPTVTATPKGGSYAAADVQLASFAGTLNHVGGDRTADLRDPLHTVTGARDARAVVGVDLSPFTVPRYGEREGQQPRSGSVENPMPTITGTNNGAQLAAVSIVKHYGGPNGHQVYGQDAGQPLDTITGKGQLGPLAVHLTQYHTEKGEETRGQSVDEPLKTLDTQNRFGIVAAHVMKFRGDSLGCSAADPMPTVTSGAGAARNAGAAHALGICAAYLSHMYTSNTCGGQGDPRKPMKTITSGGQHANVAVVFFTPYYGSQSADHGATPAEPMPTVTGKARFGVAAVESTPHWILSLPGLKRAKQVAAWAKKWLGAKVSPWLLECVDEAGKRFHLLTAAVNGVVHLVTDILMRMLRPRELARAQGFPDDYVIDRTSDGRRISIADQVKLIGNSVCPELAKRIVKLNVVDTGLLGELPAQRKRREAVPA